MHLFQEEQSKLADIKASLSDDELDEIISKTVQLKKLQATDDSPEAKATIPSLELKDLKREVTEYPIAVTENEKNTGVTVIRHELTSRFFLYLVVFSRKPVLATTMTSSFRAPLVHTPGASNLPWLPHQSLLREQTRVLSPMGTTW